MSMNLVFRVIDGSGYVEFPFQTCTCLTHAVLKKETTEERLALIKEYLEQFEGNDPEYVKETLEYIKYKLESPHLELSLM